MPDKADHGFRHFIEVGVDQVRQSSASSFEAMPVEPTRSEHDRERGVHERWLRGAQSPRVNSELPNLTRQSTQRRAGVDPEARVPRSIPVRKECASISPSPTNFGHGGALAQKSMRIAHGRGKQSPESPEAVP
jgi:hypothetical protein